MAPTLKADEIYLHAPGGAWRLALADLNDDGRNEIVYGAYDDAVRSLDPRTGDVLWSRETGGFPFSVKTFRTRRGLSILAACADGVLYALNKSGDVLWTYPTDQPLFDVEIFRAAGRELIACGGPSADVHLLDLDGHVLDTHALKETVHRLTVIRKPKEDDTLVAVDNRFDLVFLRWNGTQLRRAGERNLTVPRHAHNWENPYGLFTVMSMDAADLDGDGQVELVAGDDFHNRQRVAAFNEDGSMRWLSRSLKRMGAGFLPRSDRYYELYAGTYVRVVSDFPGSAGPVILALSGGSLRLFSADGKMLERTDSRLGFTDLMIDGQTLYLGSSPNGDDTVYRIDLAGNWQEQIARLEPQGRAAEVRSHLETLYRQTLSAKSCGNRDLDTEVIWSYWGSNESRRKLFARLREEFDYPGLRMIHSATVIEQTPPLNSDGQPWNPERWKTDSIRGGMTVEEIIERVRFFEAQKRPTVFGIGHSCMPFITLDTAEKMLKAGPEYLIGFQSAEDENPNEVARYMEEFIGPLADLCHRYGRKRVIVKNKNVWWMSMPANPRTFAALTKAHRGETIIAATEDSNSRTPEINLMARVGLRQAGAIRRYQVSVHSDLFSFNRFHQWEYPKSGHPYLRLLTAQTVLGGEPYRLFGPFINAHDDKLAFTTYGREAAQTFLHLLGKGLVVSPRPDQMAGLSTLGIAVHPFPAQWLKDGHNGHRPQAWKNDPELHQAVIPQNGCNWGLSPTPTHALQAVAFNKKRQFGYFVPPTPYGAVAIVPVHADLERVAGVEDWWHTDGIDLWREGGPRLTGEEAAAALKASLEKAAEKLPFRTAGDEVFFHSIRMDDGTYRLYMIDPGWLNPRDREVDVTVQLPGAWTVRDLLDHEAGIPVKNGRFSCRVPAGSLRILEASP